MFPKSLTLQVGSEFITAGKKKNIGEVVKDVTPSLPRENEGLYRCGHHQRQLPATRLLNSIALSTGFHKIRSIY